MKFRHIVRILLTFICIYTFNSDLGAVKKQKVIIAVPKFIIDESIPDFFATALSETLQTQFENSGRIKIKGKAEIDSAVDEMELTQHDEDSLIIDCRHDKACVKRLGRKMLVDYITYAQVSRIADWYIIDIQVIPISEMDEIPPMMIKIQKQEDFVDAVKSMGVNISSRFPIEGSILALIQNNKRAIIDLGAQNNLKTGDEFIVFQETVVEGFRDRRRVGSLIITKVQTSRSKVDVKSGRGDIREGDKVQLNQEDFLKELEDDRLANEAEVNELKGNKDKRKFSDGETEYGLLTNEGSKTEKEFARKASLIRIGYSGFGLLKLGESYHNQYYKNGFGISGDYFFYRIRSRSSGNGFDFYLRYNYRQFEMSDDSFEEFQDNYTSLSWEKDAPNPKLVTHSADIGGRFLMGGYLLFGRFDFYLIGAYRQAYIIESGINEKMNRFKSIGIGGGGIEISFLKHFAIFGEYSIGLTNGEKNSNYIDEQQVLFGVALRTDHF